MNMKKTMSSQPLQQGNYFNHMKLEEVVTIYLKCRKGKSE